MSEKEKDQVQSEAQDDQVIEDAEIVDELSAEECSPEQEVVEERPDEDAGDEVASDPEDSASEEAEVLADPSDMQMPSTSRGPLLPMALGGAVAAALGFGAAFVLGLGTGNEPSAYQQETRVLISDQAAQIEILEEELDRVEELTDQSGLKIEVAELIDTLAAELSHDQDLMYVRITSLEKTSSLLAERVDALESRPLQELASDQAVAAYEAEMTKLREAVAAHRSEIEKMAEDARAMEAAAREEALKSQGAALLTDVTLAVNSGSPFVSELSSLEAGGASIPAELKELADDGVPTLTALMESYPDAARAALRAIRQEAAGEGGQSGVLAFLQDQLGVRSVAPKDGDSPDAVLSRTEAALKSGDLSDALDGLNALPSAGQVEMADWAVLATRRLAALDALAALKQSLNDN